MLSTLHQQRGAHLIVATQILSADENVYTAYRNKTVSFNAIKTQFLAPLFILLNCFRTRVFDFALAEVKIRLRCYCF